MGLRGWHRKSETAVWSPASGRTITYGGWEVVPEVVMVADGELFGGTWIIRRCCFGRRSLHGYEVRCLLGDNDHFATRREATRAAFLRAMRTIELREVGAVHLSAIPASSLSTGVG